MAKGQGIDASLRARSELKNGVVSTVLEALAQPSSWYLPNGDAVPVMAQALRVACTFLEAAFGADASEWRWGKLHVPILLNGSLRCATHRASIQY